MRNKIGMSFLVIFVLLILNDGVQSFFNYGGPSTFRPRFNPFSNEPIGKSSTSTFNTYWGTAFPTFHSVDIEEREYECNMSSQVYEVTIPMFDSWNHDPNKKRVGASSPTRSIYLKLAPNNSNYILSETKDYSKPIVRNGKGNIVNKIEAGTEKFFCLDYATQQNVKGKDIHPFRYYCPVGFNQITKELTFIVYRHIGKISTVWNKEIAHLSVESGLCISK